ncbi:MAG TPA: cell division protein FtsL [Acidobacteriota bacterium]|nr:cell division protein FtsL [Acidobacteriota bacterium]
MTDWAQGIETRNYGIKNELDVDMLSELMRIIIALAVVAGALLFYSWIRSQIVNTGYESQSLFAEEETLLRTHQRLLLDNEVLKNPERIETIARNELGMVPLRPSQILMPGIPDLERGTSNEMAMSDAKTVSLKRPVAAKRFVDYSD